MNRPVAPDLFVGEGTNCRLVAGRRKNDNRLVFPLPMGGSADRYEVVQLAQLGRLWSWTVQRFAPKEPYDGETGERFKPYAVGYVELDNELIVESRLVNCEFEQLHIGMQMRVTTVIYRVDLQGIPILTYAFEPGHSQ